MLLNVTINNAIDINYKHKNGISEISGAIVAITKNALQAAMLNQFIYWSTRERVKDVWIYKSAKEAIEEVGFKVCERTGRNVLRQLTGMKFLERRKNPHNKWDRTYQYRPNFDVIASALRENGFELRRLEDNKK